MKSKGGPPGMGKLATIDQTKEFTIERIRATLQERYASAAFSRGLFREMGELGLLGMTVDETRGGSGGSPLEFADRVREVTRHGCDLGLSLSWVTHLALCVKSIEEFGSEEQKERYLPKLCSGEMVGAMAVSEPGSGAHPGAIKTTATQQGESFILDGTKVYITDGAVADLLVVLASTGTMPDGRKELTAFLVETPKPGFKASPMELTFLKTAPHAELRFEGVEVNRGDILCGRGEGHSIVSKAAFARERSSVMSAICGSFMAGANQVADRFRQKNEEFDLDGNEACAWIHHLSALEVYKRLTRELVEASFCDRQRWRESIDLAIYLGLSYGKWGFWLGDFVVRNRLEPTFPLDIILNDVKLVLVGEGLLVKEGKKRFMR